MVIVSACQQGFESLGSEPVSTPNPGTPAADPSPGRIEGRGERPVLRGEPVALESLPGRIVFDDFEDLFVMDPDGSDLLPLTSLPGAEFDGAWAPGGQLVAYRDSRRGINDDDEIYVVSADGSGARNLTDHPSNDWGPDWSPDGEWIVFNSDRDGTPLGGFLVRPDGSDLTPLDLDAWVEYAAFSPDGERLAFMGHAAGDYDIYVAELATREVTPLTDAPGADGWPAWSPDGSTIAFASERDDCERAPATDDCWRTGEPGEHHDIWLMNADGTDQRRVTPEFGQFVTWSPTGEYLLISGHTLFVVAPDGTGRAEIRPPGLAHSPGGIPDWSR